MVEGTRLPTDNMLKALHIELPYQPEIMEKVYELHSSGKYDVLVLDTPPTSNALDFLHAPDRILDVPDNNAMRLVLGPMLKAGRVGFRLLAAPSSLVLRTLARFTGSDFLRDLAAFMLAFEGMYEGFKERAARVKELLTSPEAGFVLVTSPNPLTTQEALFFHRALASDRIKTAAVVVNRVQRDPRRHGGPDSIQGLREALQLAQLKDENNFAERLCQTLSEQAILADLDRREVDRLRDTLRAVPFFTVPRLRKDVHDLAGLWQIVEYLGGD